MPIEASITNRDESRRNRHDLDSAVVRHDGRSTRASAGHGQRPQGLAGRVDGVHVAHEIGKVDGPLAIDERHVVGARRLVELPSDRAVGAVGDRKGSCFAYAPPKSPACGVR